MSAPPRKGSPPPLSAPPTDAPAPDPSARRCARAGFFLLALSVPLGLTFEALHALKVEVYLGSATRREMWTLAHAHGGMLGLLLLAFAAAAPSALSRPADRARVARLLVPAAYLMPLGFFAGGVLNAEGDPSLGILLVPLGGALLLAALFLALTRPRS
jgi:hypothetical protein